MPDELLLVLEKVEKEGQTTAVVPAGCVDVLYFHISVFDLSQATCFDCASSLGRQWQSNAAERK